MELDIILINILYVISFACSAYIGLSLLKLKKGPLIVNFNRSKFFEHKTIYYLLTVIYPLIFGVPLFIVCLKTGAIIPRELKCDVANPIWVRLLGYSGANFVLSIPGAYFSARSAYVLYKHLDQFKKFSSSEDISQCSFSQNHQKYNMTKDVVFRMFILSSCIILINFLASIGTILCIIVEKLEMLGGNP
ncbi:hypothetical protein C1645_812753 [Glomus cerebriforme]|uniref:Uncharacterized protein n=1 Tax=Glomus cerebriforme TaxID=658196 RepID=A0A397TPV0_9GLOM|nr:hypothetical protein C1645_812753 [Glomus cerebriforme]